MYWMAVGCIGLLMSVLDDCRVYWIVVGELEGH